MKQLLLYSWILISVVSTAQSFKALENATEIKKFEDYVYGILAMQKDTSVIDTTTQLYRVKYTTTCPFSESIYGGRAIYSTGGESFLNTENNNKEDSLTIDWWPLRDNHQTLFICKEKPAVPKENLQYFVKLTKDTIDNHLMVCSVLRAGSSYSSSKAYSVTEIHSAGYYTGYRGYSFNQQQYLILEYSGISSIGSQTSYGGTRTLFLERVDE